MKLAQKLCYVLILLNNAQLAENLFLTTVKYQRALYDVDRHR